MKETASCARLVVDSYFESGYRGRVRAVVEGDTVRLVDTKF